MSEPIKKCPEKVRVDSCGIHTCNRPANHKVLVKRGGIATEEYYCGIHAKRFKKRKSASYSDGNK